MNYSRLNHILIPSTSAERDRYRNSRIGKLFTPIFEFLRIPTPLGLTVLLLTVLIGGLGLQVDSTQVYLIFSALSGIMAAALLWRRPFSLSNVSLQVRAPKRVAVGDEIHFTVSVLNWVQWC